MNPLCSNCLNILNIYGGCDRCNKLLLKEIEGKEIMDETENYQPLYWAFGNSLGYVGEVCICAEDKEVRIGVCDDYYNFQIPFDTFLEIAEKVKELIGDGKSNN